MDELIWLTLVLWRIIGQDNNNLKFKMQKPKLQFKIQKYFLIILGLFLLLPSVVSAAELKFSTPKQALSLNETLIVEILLDTQGEDINALSGEIIFSEEFLVLKEIRDGNSIIGLWVEQPQIKEAGKVTFSGIMPGGFKGLLGADWSGVKPGLIFQLIFQTKTSGQSTIFIKEPIILLNDGQGTAAKTLANQLPIIINNLPAQTEAVIKEDKDLPEPFTPILSRDPSLFSGQWFIVFATQDKGLGIDYYAVKEGDGDFIKATSPYLLLNQKLDKSIAVKAVDRAGNERISWLAAPAAKFWYDKAPYFAIIIIGAFLLFIFLRYLKNK